MAENPRSSFIPKQTSGMIPSAVKRRKKFHAFNFVATVILLSSLAFSGGTYFYRDYSKSELEAEKAALDAQRRRFNESQITEVQQFERRLRAADYRLDNHIYLSKIFQAIELKTMENIQFTGLTLEQRPSHDVTITATGGTEEFKTLALQGFEFLGNPILKDAIFSELTTSDNEDSPRDQNAESTARINFTVKGNASSQDLVFSEQDRGVVLGQEQAVETQADGSQGNGADQGVQNQ